MTKRPPQLYSKSSSTPKTGPHKKGPFCHKTAEDVFPQHPPTRSPPENQLFSPALHQYPASRLGLDGLTDPPLRPAVSSYVLGHYKQPAATGPSQAVFKTAI